jgi:hypothetical protein
MGGPASGPSGSPCEDIGGQVGERLSQDRFGLAEEAIEGGGPIGPEVRPGGPLANGLG